MKKDYKDFYNNPDKYIPIDDLGDLCIRKFNERYAILRIIKNMTIFEKAFKLLTERGNFSRDNSFGEMHCDGYLWIMKHNKIKVIVEERQSYKFIYICDGKYFHIRALDYKYNFSEIRKRELKGVTEQKFKKQGFHPYCPQDCNVKRFDAFTYGDGRDDAYILSMDYRFYGLESCNVNDRTISAIKNIEYWDYYLDNPDALT